MNLVTPVIAYTASPNVEAHMVVELLAASNIATHV